jgi:exonuclease SbcC
MRFTALSERLKPLREQYETALSLQRESQALEKQIRDAYEALDRERYRLECDVRTLEEEGRGLAQYDAEIERLNAEITAYEDPDTRRKAAEARRAEAEEAFLRLRTEHAEFKARCEALQTRLEALTGSDAAECQYCGQPLPPSRRKEAVAQAEAETKRITGEMADVAAKGREAKKDADRYRQEAEQAQTDLRAVTTLETQRAQASQERLRVEERAKTLPDVRRRYEKLALRIVEKDYATAEQERLMQVSAQLEKMERISQQLQDTTRELEKYGDAERQMIELQQADEVMATEPARADELRALIAKREGQIEKAKKMIAENLTRTANLPALRHEQADLAARLKDAEGLRHAAEREIGEYTAKLAHCAELKAQRERRKEERLLAAKEKDRYKELAGAFGKKGVQALIIENALPEIQNQANDLLARMTNGAMQVQLMTQREAKSRSAGAIETLDIIISDDMGTRPYEMYSGGEAFRINFALRVALSKMLTHRAGAPLQTLILDEGFGTQDPRGRESIVDALHAIADQFALILVITHVEELKEAFPTRIEVVKGATGSTFTVV